jgi:hypothetical protein
MTSRRVWVVSIRHVLPLVVAALVMTAGAAVTGALEGRRIPAQPIDGDFAFSVIDVPTSSTTTARGVNNLGHIVGSYVDARGTHGFVLRDGRFATIDAPGSAWTIATGINNAGQIVGAAGTGSETGNHGFVLSRGVLTTFDVPDSVDTIANGVNNAGLIVGSFVGHDGVRHGFLSSRGSYTTIDVPGARSTSAEGINDAGQIVGRSEQQATVVGFLLTDDSYTRVQWTPGVSSTVRAVNSQGDIGGADGDPGNGLRGFIRRDGSDTLVQLPWAAAAWTVQGLNDLGALVGDFSNETGTHGYLARPPSVLPADDTRATGDATPRLARARETDPATVGTEPGPARPGRGAMTGTLSILPGESIGTIRWVTAIGSQASAAFTARRAGDLSSGEVRVSNHDGVSFTGTVRCYYQSSAHAAWFSGTIDHVEGKNVGGNNQGTSTFVMSVRSADPSTRSDGRVTLRRGLTPFDCASFHDGRQPLTAGAVIIRPR